MTSNATLITPNIGVASGTSLTTTGRGNLFSLLVPGTAAIADQGLHLQWNRSGTQGESWIINQKGGGVGGIVFGESTTGNVVTETIRINPGGDLVLNEKALLLRGPADGNHYVKWLAGIDGPAVGGFSSVALQTGGTTRFSITSSLATFTPTIRYNPGTANLALFLNGNKDLVTRPGFSYQLWNATANTGIPNNSWTMINNVTKISGGGQGELVQWSFSSASFRNDNGVSMLFMCTFTSRPVGTGIANWAAKIDMGTTTLAQTEVAAGRNEVCISATGVITPSQTISFFCNQYTGFGQNAEGIRITITTYPLL